MSLMLFYCMERLIFQGLQRIIYLRSLRYDLLNLENGNRLPIFRNYEDLRGILTIAFQMCEDMTAEFLKVYGDVT